MISFIIPTYNAEKTIQNTINSILKQSETSLEYEIIVVDDGSTDNTKNLIQEIESNQKIKYYSKENSGVADTRNFGVQKSNGEYIIFVDSDDYVSQNLLKDIEPYIKQNIDLIKWNPLFVDENKEILSTPKSAYFDIVTGEEGFNLLFGKDNLIDCLWNYAIKKEIMLEFPKGTYHEDFATMPLVILNAKTMVSLNKFEYYYVQTENSIMRSNDKQINKKKLQDKLIHFDNLIKKANNMNISKKTKENLKIYATNSMIVVVKDLEKEEKEFYIKELKKRKISKHIKIRNFKQLLKKAYLRIKY